jgi:hypothetical protein
MRDGIVRAVIVQAGARQMQDEIELGEEPETPEPGAIRITAVDHTSAAISR